jgi:hypothetical protein
VAELCISGGGFAIGIGGWFAIGIGGGIHRNTQFNNLF